MLGFTGWAGWRWIHTGMLFFALAGLRDLAAAWFLLIRRPDTSSKHPILSDALAYVSSAAQFFYVGATAQQAPSLIAISDGLAIFGFAITTLALLELGASFGVSPANRGRVGTGIYHYLRHPMYIGYGVAEIGMVLLNSNNTGIYLMSMLLYVLRAQIESQCLKEAAARSWKSV